MATKGAISALGAILLASVIAIVLVIMYVGIQHITLGQTQVLLQQGIKATGEIPCMKAPQVSLTPVLINITSEEAKKIPYGGFYTESIPFKAKISSSCMENLSIVWDFGDDTPAIETECAAPYDIQNCSLENHSYFLQGVNYEPIWSSYNVEVSALGIRSGFFTKTSADAFVSDPNFKLSGIGIDTSDFSCVTLKTSVSKTKAEELPASAYNVIDNGKQRPAENIFTESGKTSITYRSDYTSAHKVALSATKGLQTTAPLSFNFPANFGKTSRAEIATYGNPGIFNVYDSINIGLFKNGSNFPNTDYINRDIEVKDVDSNGAAEFSFLMTKDNVGELFTLPYNQLLDDVSYSALDSYDMTRLKDIWPHYDLDKLEKGPDDLGSTGWVAVAAGTNIKSPDGKTGNIVVLGNPGDLDLYRYTNGQMEQIKRGTGFYGTPVAYGSHNGNANDWQDVVTYDVNKDGENEIIALKGRYEDLNPNPSLRTADIFVFKYKDYEKAKPDSSIDCVFGTNHNASDPCWIPIPIKDPKTKEDLNINWIAVAAGRMDSNNPDAMQILTLGTSSGNKGDLYKTAYDDSSGIPATLGFLNRDWPDGPQWLDMAAADFNGDGYDEVAFLYKYNDKYSVAVLSYDKILQVRSYENFTNYAMAINQVDNPGVDWQAIAAGDFACT